MPNNQHVNKVVFNGTTLMDVSGTTVAADKLLQGYTALGPDGSLIQGSLEQQSIDFSGVNVTADKMLKGTYALDSSGNLIEGSIDVDEILRRTTSYEAPLRLKIDDGFYLTGANLTNGYVYNSNVGVYVDPLQAYKYVGISTDNNKYKTYQFRVWTGSISSNDEKSVTLYPLDYDSYVYEWSSGYDDIDCVYLVLKDQHNQNATPYEYIKRIYKIDLNKEGVTKQADGWVIFDNGIYFDHIYFASNNATYISSAIYGEYSKIYKQGISGGMTDIRFATLDDDFDSMKSGDNSYIWLINTMARLYRIRLYTQGNKFFTVKNYSPNAISDSNSVTYNGFQYLLVKLKTQEA